MQMWKQKLGSKATYTHLIQVFKSAGYQVKELKKYYIWSPLIAESV